MQDYDSTMVSSLLSIPVSFFISTMLGENVRTIQIFEELERRTGLCLEPYFECSYLLSLKITNDIGHKTLNV